MRKDERKSGKIGGTDRLHYESQRQEPVGNKHAQQPQQPDAHPVIVSGRGIVHFRLRGEAAERTQSARGGGAAARLLTCSSVMHAF